MVTASFFAAVLLLLPAGFAWALTTPPCAPSGVTHVISLVVEDTSGALQLTQALSCSSEGVSSFIEVKWVGSVIVNETLHVSHGTILDIKGTADGSSILDGAGQNALFKVFDNSTLRLSGVTLTNAASNYSDDGRDAEREVGRGGAAVMAVDSAVVSAGCIFSNNIHVAGRGYGDEGGGGGAVYLLNSTFDAVGPDVTTLVNNVAVLGDGGAIFADGESRVNVIGGGSIHFSGNSAPDGRGGAVSTGNSSVSVYSGGEVIFASNTAGDEGGGALWIGAGSSVRFLSHSRASFFNNSAIDGAGGAILLSGDGEIVLAGDTVLDSNTANQGGAIGMLRGTSASVTGNVSMSHNNATLSGGAMHCEAPALLAINGGTKFASNSVEKGSGGAITTFSAGTQGAPVVLINCTFLFNTAAGDGGALAILGGFIDIERSYFEANTAGEPLFVT